MRTFSLAVLVTVTIGAVGATTGVAPFNGTAANDEVGPGNARLLGIHHLSLREGVTAAEFERFVAEEWSPVMSNRVPGIRVMVMKGERNASDGAYLAVYDVQSVDVRDWYFPTPDDISDAFNTVNEACGEPCTSLTERFNNMAEDTGYADYVQIAGE